MYANLGPGQIAERDPPSPTGVDVLYSHEYVAERMRERNLYGYCSNDPTNATDPLGLYTLKKCTIVIFYGHGRDIKPFLEDGGLEEAELPGRIRCEFASMVCCKSETLRDLLPLLPGAVLTDQDVQFYGDENAAADDNKAWGQDLKEQNVAAAEKYAKNYLCKSPCCCEKVEIVLKCIGGVWDCLRLPWYSGKTIDCKTSQE